MNTQPRDPWQQTIDDGGVTGARLKHNAKTGAWTLDGARPADDMKIIVIMPTARHCGIRFGDDQKIAETTPSLRYDEAAPARTYPEGWDPSTTVTCVTADEARELMTFMSASWGGRRAFRRLAEGYVARGKRQFPICTLGSQLKKGDAYGNSEPVLAPVDWILSGDFSDLAPPIEAPHAAASIPYLARDIAPPPDDAFAGVDPDDLIR